MGGGVEKRKKEKGKKKNVLGTKNKNLQMSMDIMRKQVFTESCGTETKHARALPSEDAVRQHKK